MIAASWRARLGEQGQLLPAGQEGVAEPQHATPGPDRTSGSLTTSLRMFGSKETVPPFPLTSSMALVVISMIRAEKSVGPDTCRWLHPSTVQALPRSAHVTARAVLDVEDEITSTVRSGSARTRSRSGTPG